MNGLSYRNKESRPTKRVMPLPIRLLGCIIGIAFLVRADDAPAAYPPPGPFLQIENGMHTGPVRAIAIDPSERFSITASDDRTARVWDLATGKLLQVLRPPQALGGDGQLFTAAISPDGSTVALGGYTGPDPGPFSVYLFNPIPARCSEQSWDFQM